MKRFRMFLVMISAVLFSGVLSSCSKDDDFEENLAGYWYDEEVTYYLKSDGTGERKVEYDSSLGLDDEIDEFTWEATSDVISFTFESNNDSHPYNVSYKYVYTGNYLIFTDFDGAKEMVFSKKRY